MRKGLAFLCIVAGILILAIKVSGWVAFGVYMLVLGVVIVIDIEINALKR